MRDKAKIALAVLLYTVSTVGALRCFECEDMPHPYDCRVVTDCADDSECYVEEVISTGGLVLFKSGCRSTQRCAAIRSKRGDLQACSQCCSQDYCNLEGCSETNTPRDQRGPLCYDCQVQSGFRSCRSIRECGQSQVCAITNKTYSQGEYVTRCMESLQCKGVSKLQVVIVAASNGSLLTEERPYCCSDDYCNVDTKPPYIRVNGQWSTWSGYTSCTFTCGQAAMKARTRYCDSPPPSPGGLDCVGDSFEIQGCNVQPC